MSRTRARMHGRSWSNEEYRQALEAEQSAARAHLEAMASGRVPLDWAVPQALRLKVGPGGEFLPFYGDTVVFPLSPAEIAALAGLRDRLVEGLEDLFAEPLDPREFHLTLHDLSNGADLAEL
ncbi:MAG TPA: hypothetical protein VNO81_12030, partial [Candidatus Nitrosotenuis sp.]|nr:hypothetical protein [Candidatus Nitrosotenuis sp.]